MRETLLDDYIGACISNKDTLHVFKHMDEALRETKPVAHLYKSGIGDKGLPGEPISWPDGAMCVFTPNGMTCSDSHTLCLDVGEDLGTSLGWLAKVKWRLEGVLVFQADETSFDVIPLVRVRNNSLVIAEVQLHFELGDEGWSWKHSTTGPVNSTFHEPIMTNYSAESRAEFEENEAMLADVVRLYLGSYLDYLQRDGVWEIHGPKLPRLKVKNDKVKKMYKPGSVGYKEYVTKE